MEMWQIWAIVAAVMVAVEIFTAGFAAICLAIGAVASAVTAALGFGVKAQIIWFAVFTLFSFVVVRPIAIKMFFHKDKNARKSGVDALIGRVGVVSETIDSAANTGRVSIDGDDWKAVATGGCVIAKGEQVKVLEVNSVVLTVKKK
ncbi:MAG TPA: NfeD family protein [Candidatus Limisoma gallistercoris]|nr:NfeD family protein [Candidatus Limisoma gallistercoris]